MSKYLDPKNDLVFRRIFGEHPHLLLSLLNALLRFEDDRLIVSLEYMKDDIIPYSPFQKRSIVDVRCRDSKGRHFIVEMQMEWVPEFMERILYSATRIYSNQIKRGDRYIKLQPVYGLAILDCIFDKETDEYYHSFVMQNTDNPREKINGINIVSIELPKFVPQNRAEKELAVLWLRFLNEINDETENVSPELTDNSEISEALELCEEAAYTLGEYEAYEKYWDNIRREKALVSVNRTEGIAEGMVKGETIGIAKAKAEFVLNLAGKNFDIEQIAELTGLPVETVKEILDGGSK